MDYNLIQRVRDKHEIQELFYLKVNMYSDFSSKENY